MLRIKIRVAQIEDKEFIVSLLPRLMGFELPSWREPERMTVADTEVLICALSENSIDKAVLIAEDENKTPLGFIHLNSARDYYTHEKHGHISDVVVAPEGEGRGVGTALMAAAEDWARNKDYRWLTLNVFTKNLRARHLYEKLGYGEETMKYLKDLSENISE